MKKIIFTCGAALIFIFFVAAVWFVSDPVRAAKIDGYALYFADDTLRFCYLKSALYDPLALFNPFAKFLWMAIARLFYAVLPIGISSLRVMNVFFSLGITALTYKLARKSGLNPKGAFLAVFLLLSFPLYITASFSCLSEIMFCFFLLLSAYLFINERYLPGVIFASLLPLVRQEGIIFFLIWLPFIYAKKKRYLPLFFIPSFLFILADVLIAKHSPWFFFFYNFIIAEVPSSESFLPPAAKINMIFYLACQPVILFAAAEAIRELKYKKYILFTSCFFLSFLYAFIWHALFYFISGSLLREFRFTLYLFPLSAVLAASFFIKLKERSMIFGRSIFIAAFFLISVFLSIQQHYQLQQISRVSGEIVSAAEDREIRDASVWLDDYFRGSGIRNIYVFGDMVTNKFMRRLWLYLKSPVNYYAAIRDNKILDVIKFKMAPGHGISGSIVITTGKTPEAEKFRRVLINRLPLTGIDVYRIL